MDDDAHPQVDPRLDAISRGVEEVRDEMHASLADVRRLVEQSREAVFRMESALATSDPGASLRVVEVVDGVRAIAERTRRRQNWLIGVVALQAIMLAIAVALIVLMRDDVQRGPVISSDITVERAQTVSSATVPIPEPHLVATPQGPPDHPQLDDSKHRRRRHAH